MNSDQGETVLGHQSLKLTNTSFTYKRSKIKPKLYIDIFYKN